ncbi:MAG: STAS domain-containing protein [Jatrophihabitans sp.]
MTATFSRTADATPMAQMSVDTLRFNATRALIKVAGELDLASAAPLRAVLRCHLDAGRRFLRLDMSDVTFLDATALSGILASHHDLLAGRGTLVITGVRGLVARVLRLTGLDEVLFIGGPRSDDDVDRFDVDQLDGAAGPSVAPNS